MTDLEQNMNIKYFYTNTLALHSIASALPKETLEKIETHRLQYQLWHEVTEHFKHEPVVDDATTISQLSKLATEKHLVKQVFAYECLIARFVLELDHILNTILVGDE